MCPVTTYVITVPKGLRQKKNEKGWDSLERVCCISELQSMQQFAVDAHRNGEAHDGQRNSGEHSDDTELEEKQQTHHQAGEHHACPLGVLPVDQIHYWRKQGHGNREEVCTVD